MAHLFRGDETFKLLDEGINKLKQAVHVDPGKHDAFWCLGNAYTSKAGLLL